MLEREPNSSDPKPVASDTISQLTMIRNILDDRIASGHWQAARDAFFEAFAKGDIAESLTRAEESAALARASFEPLDSRIGISELFAGRALLAAGRPAEAESRLGIAIGNLCDALGDGAHEVAIAMSELATALGTGGKWSEAGLEIKRAMGILEIHAGISDSAKRDLARVTKQYAECFDELGKAGEARFYHAKAINRLEAAFGPVSDEVAAAYAAAGTAAMKQGNHSAAIPDLSHSVHLMDALYGEHDRRSLVGRVHLSAALRFTGQHEKARGYALHAVDSLTADPDSQLMAEAKNNLALATYNLGRATEALPLFLEVLESEVARLGSDHPTLAATHYNVGSCQAECGDHAGAEKSLLESLRLMKQVRAESDQDLISIKKALASAYLELGRPFRAEGMLRQIFNECEGTFAPDNPQTLMTLRQLISVCIGNSNIAEAEKLNAVFEERVAAAQGPLRILYADALDNAAGIALIRKDYGEAERLFSEELAIQKEILGPDAPQLAQTYQNLAQTYIAAEEHEKAGEMLEQSLRLFEAAHGECSHHVANCLHLMGRVAHEEKDYEAAAERYDRALAIHDELSGPRGGPVVVPVLNDYATMLRDLGNLYADEEELSRSLALFERARDILVVFGRDEHPTMVSVLNNMSAVLDDLDREDEAESLRREAETIRIAIGFRNDTEVE